MASLPLCFHNRFFRFLFPSPVRYTDDTGSGWDELTDDNVLFQAAERVDLTF